MRLHRISALPRFLACASSEAEGDWEYREDLELGAAGTAVHRALELHTGGFDVDVAAIARDHAADFDEVLRLYRWGVQAWLELRRFFPSPLRELHVETPYSRGTLDLAQHDGATAAVLDWKSGWSRRNHRGQVLGYADGLRDRCGMPTSGRIQCAIGWLRYREVDVWSVTEADLDAFRLLVEAQRRRIGTQYAAGEHCQFCPRRMGCEAREAHARSAGAAIAAVPTQGMTPSRLAELFYQARDLRAALAHYDQALKTAVADAGGKLGIPGTDETLVLEEHHRDELDVATAWPVMVEAGLTEEQIAGCLTLSKDAVLEAAATGAPKGYGAHRKRSMLRRLKDAGAVRQKAHLRLEVQQAPALAELDVAEPSTPAPPPNPDPEAEWPRGIEHRCCLCGRPVGDEWRGLCLIPVHRRCAADASRDG